MCPSKQLQNVIGKVILNDQTGYIKRRFIGCNARLLNDIIHYTDDHQTPGVLLFLDSKKRLIPLNGTFCLKYSKILIFGPYFIHLIKILYNNASFMIRNNGWLSEIQDMRRGIREDFPVFAQIFTLVLEIMSLNIKNADDINGFELPGGIESKLSQYADRQLNFDLSEH